MTAAHIQRLIVCALALFAIVACGAAFAAASIEAAAVRKAMESGDYTGAIETANDLLTLDANRGGILNALGEAQFTVGDAAQVSFERAYTLNDANRLEAMQNLGKLARYQGDGEAATQWFHRVVAYYNLHPDLSSTELAAVAASAEALGDSEPDFYHDAVRVYGESALADRDNVAAPVALGNLLLDKYNNTEALETFRLHFSALPAASTSTTVAMPWRLSTGASRKTRTTSPRALSSRSC
jgi:tetratricopeptide (TPR) repeat protein